ncbi:MAG: hypothetical protein IK120_07095 [Muribaculaceae bacterium]|nr:hypothetical protein [Muribaculaceae bacterium]
MAGKIRKDGTTHKEHRNFTGYGQYVGKAIINGQEEYVRFTVRIQRNQNGVHNVFVTDIDLYENLSRDASLAESNVGARLVNGRVLDTKLENIFYLPKNPQKLLQKTASRW